jgi:hypothetical protein
MSRQPPRPNENDVRSSLPRATWLVMPTERPGRSHAPKLDPVDVTLAAPSDITVRSLLGARMKDLVFLIKQVNVAAGRKVLTQQGTVQTLREKLAAHYSIDLNATTPNPKSQTIPGLFSMDLQLQRDQWADFRALGMEWEAKATAGLPFLLLSGEFLPLPSIVPSSSDLWRLQSPTSTGLPSLNNHHLPRHRPKPTVATAASRSAQAPPLPSHCPKMCRCPSTATLCMPRLKQRECSIRYAHSDTLCSFFTAHFVCRATSPTAAAL